MKKILLLLLLALNLTAFGQYQQGGIKVVGGVAVMQVDTNARTIIKIIEDERIAGGGSAFTLSEKHYVNYIVTSLKKIGVWTKIKALYGFVGGTASSHKWNWKDMRDLDVAYRLTFNGGIVHSSNGVQFNGSTGYANTFLIPSTQLIEGDNHLSVYIKNSNISTSTSTPYVIGVINSPNVDNNFALTDRHNSTSQLKLFRSSNNIGNTDVLAYLNSTQTPYLGFLLGNIKNNLISYNNNGVNVSNSFITTASGLPNVSVFIGASNINSSAIFFDNKLINYSSIGSGLTDAEAIQMSNIVTFAQGILGRQ